MKEEKKVKGRRRYDAEFKLNVLEMHRNGRSVPSLAESFGINENIIYRWKKEAKKSIMLVWLSPSRKMKSNLFMLPVLGE